MPTVKALADADLMRLCVPAVYGGPEVDPMTMVEVIEAVAQCRRRGGMVHDDRVDDVVDGVVPAGGRGAGDLRRSVVDHRWRVRSERPGRVGRARDGVDGLRGDRTMGVGEWHPALSMGARRRVVRRRNVPAVLDAAVGGHVPRHLAHVGHARFGIARLLGRRGVRSRRADDPAGRDQAGRRRSRSPASRTSVCSPPGCRRSGSASPGVRSTR